jgi:hypothetical protein
MNEGFIQALVYNASLLLALALLFDLVAIRLPIAKINIWQIPLGVVIGGIGITVMQTPWILTPGIIFDTRSIILGISGLFFGLIPTVIGMLMTAAFRIYQGGARCNHFFWNDRTSLATLTEKKYIENIFEGIVWVWNHYPPGDACHGVIIAMANNNENSK